MSRLVTEAFLSIVASRLEFRPGFFDRLVHDLEVQVAGGKARAESEKS